MTNLLAKLLTATIKNRHKQLFVYKMLTDNEFASDTIKKEVYIEKMLNYIHNYLALGNCIVVNLFGGLGNQMLLYAFGKALQTKGYNVIFDASDGNYSFNPPPKYTKTPTNIRNLEITNFNITIPIDLTFDKRIFFALVDKEIGQKLSSNKKSNYCYKYIIDSNPTKIIPLETINILPNTYFRNCWFSHSYFKHIDSKIRKEFQLKIPLSTENIKLKEHILNTQNSVFLHIRRGDFLNLDNVVNLDGKYYSGCVNYIKSFLGQAHIFIFSNDIAWCEKEFLGILSDECKEGVEFEFVANNGEDSAVQEMELMRSCKHAIIANSSFSWWASYLINNPQKIVMMPNLHFYTRNPNPLYYDDISQVFDGVVLVDVTTGNILY